MYQDTIITNNIYSKGISLIEIMVSILFFSLISLCLAHTLSSSLYLTAQDGDIVNTTNLAKFYLDEISQNWKTQLSYDSPTIPGIEEVGITDGGEYELTSPIYTQNGRYNALIYTKNISNDDLGNVNIRRVRIKYFDHEDNELIDLYLDYARPGSYVVP